jgi:hypothetical protein
MKLKQFTVRITTPSDLTDKELHDLLTRSATIKMLKAKVEVQGELVYDDKTLEGD